MTDDELREKVIGCAYRVHSRLGGGFLEKVYENALRIELERQGFRVRAQAPIEVFYEGEVVGEFFADLFIEERLIVELKAANCLVIEHEAQLVNYLKATNTEDGLLINFGRSVTVRRKFRDYQKQSCKS